MEQFHEQIKQVLDLPDIDANGLSALGLAYIGDCVFDLVIKTMIIAAGNRSVKNLHNDTSALVQAASQSRMMRFMQEHLDDEERGVYHRGRNAKSVSPAKNQTITDYRRATGFEALIGYLYLKGRTERLLELIRIGLDGDVSDEKEASN